MSLRRTLLSQSSTIFVVRLFGAGLIFLAQAVITWAWGAHALGEYLLIIAATNIIGVILPLGFQTIASYFAAEYRIKGEGTVLRRFVLQAYGHVIVLTGALVFVGPMVASVAGEAGQVLLAYWWPLCLMTVGNGLMMVASALLIGLKKPYASFFADSIVRAPLIIGSVGITALALTTGDRFALLVWLVAGAYFFTGSVQAIYSLVVTRAVPRAAPPMPDQPRRWWRFALPWIIIVVATDFFYDFDLIFLASIMAKDDLAVFGVCARLFSLAAFGVTAVYAVTLPDIFESEVKGGGDTFLRKLGDTNLIATAIALALLVGLLIGGPIVLLLFGPEFQEGALPLVILGVTLVIRALMGPAALVVSMRDRPNTTLPSVFLVVATLIIANIVLVPLMGILGAALAAMLAQSVWSVGMWVTARRVAKVDVSIFPRLREMLLARRQAAPAK